MEKPELVNLVGYRPDIDLLEAGCGELPKLVDEDLRGTDR